MNKSALEVQNYLRTFYSLEEGLAQLKETYGIKSRVYLEDKIVLLDYDQIESPKTHPITIECRSLILSTVDLEVVSRKFDRFFNLGEAPELYEFFDFKHAVVMEKADGSLIGVYHNPHTNRWEISTRGMAKAEGEHVFGGTWRDKVLAAFGFESEDEMQDYFSANLDEGHTYIFEYISPENRIVTKYDEPMMVMTGIRSRCGVEEQFDVMSWAPDVLPDLNIRLPKLYSPESREDMKLLVEMADALEGLEEGFIVWCEKTQRRVKVKSKTYLVAHKLRGNDAVPTRKNVMTLVLEGEVDEFLAYFPEWNNIISEAQAEVNAILEDAEEFWEKAKNIESQKEYALVVKSAKAPWILFSARKTGASPTVEFHKAQLSQKLKTVGV